MAHRGTILVAEDEGLARRTLVELLHEEGCHVKKRTAAALGLSLASLYRKLEALDVHSK